ncbi:hypothetical protein EGR_08229 [Echinococcus granulosus]|uniref:Uncharacterized protein n=1 Tax=Echinococcus granulosus TaxID=6210 RepID=W6U6Q8_ECHGR|nr:hypothetical protein EGR_08229 [Echinococcus granulosus]EUB56923.1 hypothetical protein EGR_08229 [Echinococcus granulosus]
MRSVSCCTILRKQKSLPTDSLSPSPFCGSTERRRKKKEEEKEEEEDGAAENNNRGDDRDYGDFQQIYLNYIICEENNPNFLHTVPEKVYFADKFSTLFQLVNQER